MVGQMYHVCQCMLISRVHILQLSPEERALREKQIRKEMAELNYYWQDHPEELLAKI